MRTFKNLKVGTLETVNDTLAVQYEKRPDKYKEVTSKSDTATPSAVTSSKKKSK